MKTKHIKQLEQGLLQHSDDYEFTRHVVPGWINQGILSVIFSSEVPGIPVCVLSCSVVSDLLRPQGLQPTRLFCPWNSPGKNIGVACHILLQGIWPTQRLKACLLCLLHLLQWNTWRSHHKGIRFSLEHHNRSTQTVRRVENNLAWKSGGGGLVIDGDFSWVLKDEQKFPGEWLGWEELDMKIRVKIQEGLTCTAKAGSRRELPEQMACWDRPRSPRKILSSIGRWPELKLPLDTFSPGRRGGGLQLWGNEYFLKKDQSSGLCSAGDLPQLFHSFSSCLSFQLGRCVQRPMITQLLS